MTSDSKQDDSLELYTFFFVCRTCKEDRGRYVIWYDYYAVTSYDYCVICEYCEEKFKVGYGVKTKLIDEPVC
ncbi:hypothetical protein CEXT_641791 [Caerostris extrusa]|uniref:Uncharacterized protein n=1 Tax=Caerostris extrusa TaxID=172846 RepID=A0AAV4PCV3_CAEEX|nr:hypothetical protein CEXT_641791 [Caerostris extrusa]